MKTYVKLITFLIMAVFVFSLVGCQPAATEAPATEAVAEEHTDEHAAEEPTAAPVVEEPTAAPTDVPAPTEEPAPTDVPAPEPVTIRYANWNLGTEEENNIQRQLVQAYIDEHPYVTVEFVDMSGDAGWDAVLTAYAAKGELPDVFMANNMPLYVQNDWVADLTDLVKDDADWANVPQALKDAFTYSDKVLGLPAAHFLMGYFVNISLFEAANLDAPEYGVSVEDFFAAATALQNLDKSILGMDEIEPVLGWYGSTVDPNLGYFSFDGTKMNYNSAAFKSAVAQAAEIKPYTWQGLTDEQKATFKAQGPWELFLNQEVGLRWDAGWSFPNYVQNATFDWDFIGVPGGNQALVADVIVVSKTAANVEESYNFAKWMTYSTAAYAKEVEFAKAAGSAPKMPVSLDDASVALFTEFVDKPGVLAALDNLDNSMIESLAKIVPGYIQARWEGKPGIDIGEDKDVTMGYMFDNATSGKYKFEDYSAQLEEFANKIMEEARALLNH